MSEAQQPSGRFPGYLVIAEVERRQQFRDRYNASQQAQEGEQPTIMEQAVEEFSGGIPSADPNFQGQQPGPQMAGGGKVPRYFAGTFGSPSLRGRLFTSPAAHADEIDEDDEKIIKAAIAGGLQFDPSLNIEELLEQSKAAIGQAPETYVPGQGTLPGKVDFSISPTPTTSPSLTAADIRGMADQSLGVSEQDILSASGVTRDPSGGLAVTRRQGDQAAIDAAKARIAANQRQLDPTNTSGIAALANRIALDTMTPSEYEEDLKKYTDSLSPGSKDAGLEMLRDYRPDRAKTSARKTSTMLQGLGEMVLNLGHNNEAAFQALPAATREIEGIEDKYKDDAFKIDLAILQRTEGRQDKLLDASAKRAGLKDARELKAFETQATYQRTQAAMNAEIRGDTETQQKIEQEERETLERTVAAVVNLKQANLQSVIDVSQAVTNRMNSIAQSQLAANAVWKSEFDKDRFSADVLKENIRTLSEKFPLTDSDITILEDYRDRLKIILDKYAKVQVGPTPSSNDPKNLGI